MDSAMFLLTGLLLVVIALFFWGKVSSHESPLLNLTYRWTRLTNLVFVSLIFGILSMAYFAIGLKMLYPSMDTQLIWQNLFVVYIILFGMMYPLSAMHFYKLERYIEHYLV